MQSHSHSAESDCNVSKYTIIEQSLQSKEAWDGALNLVAADCESTSFSPRLFMMMMHHYCAHCFVDEVWILLSFRLFWLFKSQCLFRFWKLTGNYKIFEHPDLKSSNNLSEVSLVIDDSGLSKAEEHSSALLVDEVAIFVLIWQWLCVVRSCQEELKIKPTSLVS